VAVKLSPCVRLEATRIGSLPRTMLQAASLAKFVHGPVWTRLQRVNGTELPIASSLPSSHPALGPYCSGLSGPLQQSPWKPGFAQPAIGSRCHYGVFAAPQMPTSKSPCGLETGGDVRRYGVQYIYCTVLYCTKQISDHILNEFLHSAFSD
jgi:hypothetical protein